MSTGLVLVCCTSLGAQGIHCQSHRLPALCLKLRFYLFFPLKVDPLSLESQNQIFLWISRVPQSKIEANRSRSSGVMIGQTNRQTEITTLYVQIFTVFKTTPTSDDPHIIEEIPSIYTRHTDRNHVGLPLYWFLQLQDSDIILEGWRLVVFVDHNPLHLNTTGCYDSFNHLIK